MKLHSAQIHNYRIHRDCAIDFNHPLTLIHGPNESGKSTLVEAIHAALFLKAKGTTELHKRMYSDLAGGDDPSVRLQFATGSGRHTVTKVFGNKGTCTVESEGHATLSGDAAEQRLAELLGVEGAVSGPGAANTLPKRWAHLWIWQGHSSGSPIAAIEESERQLRQKLQAHSGQMIVSSPTDAAVIEHLQDLVNATLTSTGRPKVGSELQKAEAALKSSQESLADKQATLERLRQASEDCEQAEKDVCRHEKNIVDANARLKTIREKLETVRSHRDKLKEKSVERQTVQKELEALINSDNEIRDLEARIKTSRHTTAPGQQQVEALELQLKEARAELDTATRTREAAAEKVSQLRTVADAWQAHLNTLDSAKRVADLNASKVQVEAVKTKQKQLLEQLAPLDGFTTKTIKALRAKVAKAQHAQAQLDAYALHLECIQADQTLILDGEAFSPGDSRTLSRPAELQIGDGTRIRLSPGGAQDLRKAQDAARDVQAEMSDALLKMAVSSLEVAEEKLHQREALERDLTATKDNLTARSADTLESELNEAVESHARSRTRRDDLADKIAAVTFPEDRKKAENSSNEAAQTLRLAESECDAANLSEKAARKAADKAETALASAKEKLQQALADQRDLEVRLKFAVDKAGPATARTEMIDSLKAKVDQTTAAENKEAQALESLGADQLELDRERLETALQQDQQKLADAQGRKIAARSELRSNGSSDPEQEAKEAQAICERDEKRHQSLRKQAEVRSYLLDRLKAARQATVATLARPLEEAVAPYLQLLFHGSQAKIHWAEDGSRIERFEIDRTQHRSGLYNFDQLSHGTREQAALALRLAMAGLLADDFDGCLPLVLDDAFTHADRNRIESLKSLLYRAGQNGLQIILLTCHPENYSGLGGEEFHLSP